MNQKELVGGVILIAAIVILMRIVSFLLNIFSGLFWVIAAGIAIYAFLNPTFRNQMFSVFRYIYGRIFKD